MCLRVSDFDCPVIDHHPTRTRHYLGGSHPDRAAGTLIEVKVGPERAAQELDTGDGHRIAFEQMNAQPVCRLAHRGQRLLATGVEVLVIAGDLHDRVIGKGLARPLQGERGLADVAGEHDQIEGIARRARHEGGMLDMQIGEHEQAHGIETLTQNLV